MTAKTLTAIESIAALVYDCTNAKLLSILCNLDLDELVEDVREKLADRKQIDGKDVWRISSYTVYSGQYLKFIELNKTIKNE